MDSEKEYLAYVTKKLDQKIESTILKTEKLKKEVENIGIPNFDEKNIFKVVRIRFMNQVE